MFGTAERAGPDKEQLVGPSRARTKLDWTCGAIRVAEHGERKCLRVKQRQIAAQGVSLYRREREDGAEDQVALKRRYNKDMRLSLLYS
jgi:hypothetical protein